MSTALLTDLTIFVLSLWVGFEVINHAASDGVAIGECFLYDEDGPIGSASCAALAQRRMRG